MIAVGPILYVVPCLRPCHSLIPAFPRDVRQPPKGEQWLHQPKLDGWRCQAVKVGTTVALYSRNGNELTKRFPAIVGAMVKLPAKTVVLDGELVQAGSLPCTGRLIGWCRLGSKPCFRRPVFMDIATLAAVHGDLFVRQAGEAVFVCENARRNIAPRFWARIDDHPAHRMPRSYFAIPRSKHPRRHLHRQACDQRPHVKCSVILLYEKDEGEFVERPPSKPLFRCRRPVEIS